MVGGDPRGQAVTANQRQQGQVGGLARLSLPGVDHRRRQQQPLGGDALTDKTRGWQVYQGLGEFTAQDMKYTSKDLPQTVDIKYAQLKFSPAFVELVSFDSKIGKSDFKANGKIENFLDYFFAENGLLKGNFNLNSNQIDLNEFMRREEETTAATHDTASLAVIDVPANIDFTLTASIGQLLYDNMEITNVTGNNIRKENF